jgi:hypothetical protein
VLPDRRRTSPDGKDERLRIAEKLPYAGMIRIRF